MDGEIVRGLAFPGKAFALYVKCSRYISWLHGLLDV